MKDDDVRRLLQDRRSELRSVLRQSADFGKPVELDQVAVGRLSRMDAMARQAMAKATRQKYLLEMKKLDAALARLDAGEYGVCVGCGEEIAPNRLKADPMVAACLSCASGGGR